MKAYLMEKPGIENMKLVEMDEPEIGKGMVKVFPRLAGINPLDYKVIAGNVLYEVNPMPHIPGSEIFGEVAENSGNFKKGERVIVYNKIFDGVCKYCMEGREYLCQSGGFYGVATNGGFAQSIAVKEENLIRVPDSVDDNLAASLPIAAITPYHALKEVNAGAGKSMIVYGASGNTGAFAIQLGKIMGMRVFAVSSKDSLASLGAEKTFRIENIPPDLKADIIINSLGGDIFSKSIEHLDKRGSLVTFGIMKGREANLDIGKIYTNELKIVGSTGGSRLDMMELMELASYNKLKVTIDKTFPFEDLNKALKYFEGDRNGRVLLKF
ncbi:MAG: alcohol dehydrogenase catalytic domain-containing protein [Cuniculiplasma sp.]